MARKPKKPQTPTGSASKATGWRSILKVHPAAETFPRMSPEEVDRLGQDIRQHGMQSPIALFCSDPRRDPRLGEVQLLDGISRLDALESVGYRLVSMGLGILNIEWAGSGEVPDPGEDRDPLPRYKVVEPPVDPYDFVISANIHRRHLTAKQRRDLITDLLKRHPEKSDREIGRQIKADNKTVASVRAKKESREEIPHVETRTDSKGRKQPARKPRSAKTKVEEPAPTDARASADKPEPVPTQPDPAPTDARARATVKATGDGNAQPAEPVDARASTAETKAADQEPAPVQPGVAPAAAELARMLATVVKQEFFNTEAVVEHLIDQGAVDLAERLDDEFEGNEPTFTERLRGLTDSIKKVIERQERERAAAESAPRRKTRKRKQQSTDEQRRRHKEPTQPVESVE